MHEPLTTAAILTLAALAGIVIAGLAYRAGRRDGVDQVLDAIARARSGPAPTDTTFEPTKDAS